MDLERAKSYPLRRREVVARLLADRGDRLVVTGLGATSWDAAAAGDHPLTFPLWGAMGGTVSMALGLALAQRRELRPLGVGEPSEARQSLWVLCVGWRDDRRGPDNHEASRPMVPPDRYSMTNASTAATAFEAAATQTCTAWSCVGSAMRPAPHRDHCG